MAEVIDINVFPTIETINLTVEPNLITINVNQVIGGGDVDSVNGQTGVVVLNQDDILDGTTFKQYSLTEKNKLAGIAAGAEVNVNADWNATTGDAQILNKPTIPTAVTQTSQLTNNGADGVNPFITALDIPTTGQASTLVREVKNMTGATLTKGTVVFISGANGNKPLVSKALATTDALSSRTFGLLQSDILNNGLGNCVIIGDLSGLDTSAFAEGAQLYLSGVTAGTYTASKILAPTHLVYVGKVTRSHPTQGQIEVGIQNGYELEEIHDCQIITPLNNQALTYETSTDLWKNKTIIEDNITDGVTTIAPSQNAVFDALATKFTLPSLTSGSVLFSNGSTIAQDNAQLFWDDTNNRLGIGTNAPVYKLHITGSFANYTGGLLVENTGSASIDFKNVAAFVGNRGNASNIDDNTNIGIQQKSNIVNNYGVVNFYNAAGQLSSYIGCQYTNHGTSPTANFVFGLANGNGASNLFTRMIITNIGNVGIGTTIPQARLDVRAQGALSTDIAFRVRNSADTANLVTVQGNAVTKFGNTVFNDPNSILTIGIDGSTSARATVANNATYQDFVFVNTSIASGNINSWSFGQRRDTVFGNALGSFQIVGAYFDNAGAASSVGGGFRVPLICNPNGDVIIAGATANAVNGNVLIGTTTSSASAKVRIDSTTQGFLPPRMTTTQKNAIASPAAGLVVYDSTLNKLCVYTTAWETITSS